MKSIQTIIQRINNYDFDSKTTFKYNDLLTFEENRGYFLSKVVDQFIGDYVESAIPEWNPDPESRHLGVGLKTDWEDSIRVAEQKKNPSTDNSSSRKSNLIKLKQSAQEKGKIPIYTYWEDRKKNDYMKDGVRHLHGKAIFRVLGIEDQWTDFLSDVESVKIVIVDKLRNKFNEHYQRSFV